MSSGRSARAELADLLQQAYLPNVVTIRQLTGRGFDNEVYVAQLSGGRQVVLRRWQEPREPEEPRARFLLTHGVPTPLLLAATPTCALYDFAPGS
ncbi:MAG: phosphotransferase family protein, partial [Chloroflexota bacterium]